MWLLPQAAIFSNMQSVIAWCCVGACTKLKTQWQVIEAPSPMRIEINISSSKTLHMPHRWNLIASLKSMYWFAKIMAAIAACGRSPSSFLVLTFSLFFCPEQANIFLQKFAHASSLKSYRIAEINVLLHGLSQRPVISPMACPTLFWKLLHYLVADLLCVAREKEFVEKIKRSYKWFNECFRGYE